MSSMGEWEVKHCCYCGILIKPPWMIDMYVINWTKQVRQDPDGRKLFGTKVPKERVCRRCYFNEYKTNIIGQKR